MTQRKAMLILGGVLAGGAVAFAGSGLWALRPFTAVWRSTQYECLGLLSGEEVSRGTGLTFELQSPPPRDHAAGCSAAWSEGAQLNQLRVEASPVDALDPAAALRRLETDGMQVSVLELGDWAYLGETDDAPPAPPAAADEPEPPLLDGLPERFGKVTLPLEPQPSARALISRCGVLLTIEAHGPVASERVPQLAELATPRFDPLCKFASPWPRRAPWVRPVAYTGEKPLPDPLIAENAATRHAERYLDGWQFELAVRELQKGVALRETRLGADAVETGELLRRLGFALRGAHQLGESERVLLRSLAIAEQGDDFVEQARVMDSLGQTIVRAGRIREGIALQQKALALHDAHHTPRKDPERVALYNNLAMSYGDLGDHVREAALFEKVLAVDEAAGPSSLDTANTLNNLALAYRDSMKLAKAAVLFQRAYVILVDRLGDQHPRLVPTLNGLAGTHYLANRFGPAERAARAALDVSDANGQQPDSVTLSVLGDVAVARARYSEALTWLNRAVDLDEAVQPETSTELMRSLIKRSIALGALGRVDESRRDETRALEIAARVFGEGSAEFIAKLDWLASDLANVGERTRAKALEKRAKALRAGAGGAGPGARRG